MEDFLRKQRRVQRGGRYRICSNNKGFRTK